MKTSLLQTAFPHLPVSSAGLFAVSLLTSYSCLSKGVFDSDLKEEMYFTSQLGAQTYKNTASRAIETQLYQQILTSTRLCNAH